MTGSRHISPLRVGGSGAGHAITSLGNTSDPHGRFDRSNQSLTDGHQTQGREWGGKDSGESRSDEEAISRTNAHCGPCVHLCLSRLATTATRHTRAGAVYVRPSPRLPMRVSAFVGHFGRAVQDRGAGVKRSWYIFPATLAFRRAASCEIASVLQAVRLDRAGCLTRWPRAVHGGQNAAHSVWKTKDMDVRARTECSREIAEIINHGEVQFCKAPEGGCRELF